MRLDHDRTRLHVPARLAALIPARQRLRPRSGPTGFVRILTLATAALAAGHTLAGASGPQAATPHVSARLVAGADTVAPGDTITLGLAKRIAPDWHTYWRNPGDSGLATRVEWTLPAGATAGPLQWPAPAGQRFGPVMNYGYEGEVTLLAEFTAPPTARAGERLTVHAIADWLACREVCIPEQLQLTLTLPVTTTTQGAPHPAIEAARAQLPQPAPWPVRYALQDGALALDIRSGALSEAGAEFAFFPHAWGLIEHAAPQTLHTTTQGVRLMLPPGPAAGDGPLTLDGVLVITERHAGGDLRRAFELAAPRVDVLESTITGTPADAAPPAAVIPAIGLAGALLFALLGGLILNLMPCVFPVLAMKVVALVQHSHGEQARITRHGLAYLAGVLASFALLGAVVLALQAGGAQLGWGFQFHSPLFVLLVSWLLFAVGLNLSGVFTIGGGLAGVGHRLTTQGGYRGSFFTGVLAAVVATPCTAPFMGVAIGYAMTQPPAILLAIFLALGLGLALPFVALALRPALLRRLPRPGAWMLRLKQALAFPMYAAAIWLVWVLTLQSGANGLLLALGGMLAIAFAAWLYDSAWQARTSTGRGTRGAAATIVALTLATAVVLQPAPTGAPVAAPGTDATLPYRPWSPAELAALRAAGRPVFINFTAAWCITCLVNERVALNRPDVAAAFAAQDIAYLKGDWTRQDPDITAVLKTHGRSGVPLYLFYPASAASTPVVLPQLLTADIVLRSIAAATPASQLQDASRHPNRLEAAEHNQGEPQ